MNKKKITILTKVCLGFNSICEDGKHILLLDYDLNKDRLQDIECELMTVSKRYKLSDMYIFESTNGFNVVCLSKRNIKIVEQIRNDCNFSDKKHNEIGLKRNGWVLRIGYDKKLCSHIEIEQEGDELSNAHRILLNALYGLTINKSRYFDNLTDVLFEKYVQKKGMK